jgi:addiction module RelE/StbE family toxin
MNKRFRVIWTESAAKDLEEIVAFISVDSPSKARGVLQRIRKRAQILRSLPNRGRYLPELLESGLRSWRELVIDPYRLIYRIEGNKVFVNAVLDGRRDLRDTLLNILMR